MSGHSEIQAREEGLALTPRSDGAGLLPAVVTDAVSGTVLMLARMNGEAWFWSRSRQCLWHKGATSGQVQRIQEIRVDCDQDTIWLRVRMSEQAGCCHTGRSSCFYRRVVSGPMLALDPVALGRPAEQS